MAKTEKKKEKEKTCWEVWSESIERQAKLSREIAEKQQEMFTEFVKVWTRCAWPMAWWPSPSPPPKKED